MTDIKTLIEKILAGPEEPDKEYVISRHTYADVYAMAAGLVNRFAPLVHENEPVCVCTEDAGVIMAAMLASLAGCPLFMLPYSLSLQVLAETRDALNYRYALIDRDIEVPEGVIRILPERASWPVHLEVGPRDADSVYGYLFTGGSTGKPKVWSKTPVNLFAEAAYQAEKYRFSESDLVASTVPPYHIYGLLYTVMAPFIGSSSVLDGTYVFPHEIAAVLRENPVTILVSVPVHYRVLNGVDIKAPHLRMSFSSAGPLDAADAAAFYDATGVGPEEIYGSTETGGIACKSSAAGRGVLEPFECLDWKISEDLLCVRSPFVSPDLPVDGEGYFVTGDRAAPAAEKCFTLLGRSDGVVKVGGKRVDLNGVREKMKIVPGVRDAYLFSLPGTKGRGTEIAAVVEADMTETDLRAALDGTLEQYAMPRRVRIVGRMPSTSTGKYDREAIIKLFESDRGEG